MALIIVYGAAMHMDWPRRRRLRTRVHCTGHPPLGQPCAVAPGLHLPQPLPNRQGFAPLHRLALTETASQECFSVSKQPVGTAIATHAGIHTACPSDFASPSSRCDTCNSWCAAVSTWLDLCINYPRPLAARGWQLRGSLARLRTR